MHRNNFFFKLIGHVKRELKRPLSSNSGVALMMAIFCVMLIVYLATEVSYESNVEYIVNSQSVNRIKAHYAALAGVELSLYRIKLYQKAMSQFGKSLGSQAKQLDMIWSFPFSWPLVLPDAISEVDKDMAKKVQKESTLDAQYVVTIEDEGSKIDINDLASPSKVLRESTRKQLENIFENKTKNDEEWAKKNRDLKYDEVINNIADWIDDDTKSANGGDESALYSDMGEGFPPNRAFRTLEELRLVAGMTDDIYDLLAPRITIYGMKGINPNYASKEVLQSLSPEMTNEVVDAVIKRRDSDTEGGFFQNADDFVSFAQSKGATLPDEVKKVLIFDSVMNFHIRSIGSFAQASKEINVIVYDTQKITNRVADLVKKENPDPSKKDDSKTADPSKTDQPKTQTQQETISKGAPRIVYWDER